MRTGLVVLGIILLVIGGLLYYIPIQRAPPDVARGVSQATASNLSVAAGISLLAGFVLLILGLVIPDKQAEIERVDNQEHKKSMKGRKPAPH